MDIIMKTGKQLSVIFAIFVTLILCLSAINNVFASDAIFVPVTDIINVPEEAIAGVPLNLAGTVIPANATKEHRLECQKRGKYRCNDNAEYPATLQARVRWWSLPP